MAKRLIDIMRVLVRELRENGYNIDDALKKTSFDIDFLTLKEELLTLESTKYLDDTELDTIRTCLVHILMKETNISIEDIYAFIFGGGKQIIWN